MATPLTYEIVKKRIAYLHHNHPDIHVNIRLRHPKESLTNAPATIVQVYPNIFALSETSKGYEDRHTLKYSDVLVGNVEIIEFSKFK